MKNLRNLAAAGALLYSGAADAVEVTDIDAAAMIHYCPAEAGKPVNFGEVIATTGEFNQMFRDAVNVEPEELKAARQEKAKETLKAALFELSPDQIRILGERIKLVSEVKPGQIGSSDLKAEDEILAALKTKLAALSTLVTIDPSGEMRIVEVDVTAKALERVDVEAAFGELAKRGIECPADVISYVVTKDRFPTLSDTGNNSPEYDAFVAAAHQKIEAPTPAPTPTPAQKTPEVPADPNVIFMKKLQEILTRFNKLQKNAGPAIVAYTAYIESYNEQ